MRVEFNRTGAERKALVTAISEILGTKAKYMGMPTTAYDFGGLIVDKLSLIHIQMCIRDSSRYAVKENAIPVTPHLLYPQFMDDGNDAEREMAMHFNYVLLGKCTELWVFGGVVSRGMAREIGVAKKRRMKIRWFDHAMKEVNEYA